jgi:hypothetical protein
MVMKVLLFFLIVGLWDVITANDLVAVSSHHSTTLALLITAMKDQMLLEAIEDSQNLLRHLALTLSAEDHFAPGLRPSSPSAPSVLLPEEEMIIAEENDLLCWRIPRNKVPAIRGATGVLADDDTIIGYGSMGGQRSPTRSSSPTSSPFSPSSVLFDRDLGFSRKRNNTRRPNSQKRISKDELTTLKTKSPMRRVDTSSGNLAGELAEAKLIQRMRRQQRENKSSSNVSAATNTASMIEHHANQVLTAIASELVQLAVARGSCDDVTCQVSVVAHTQHAIRKSTVKVFNEK